MTTTITILTAIISTITVTITPFTASLKNDNDINEISEVYYNYLDNINYASAHGRPTSELG